MWLKIETGLPTKVEVFRMAEALQVKRAEVVGHLVNLWAWFDFNTENGVINNIGSNGIIDAHTTKGFADAMHSVGWLEYNKDWETAGIQKLILPNFERHNGQTAKKRANTQQRQQRFRNAKALSSASLDKKREDKKKEEKREVTPYQKIVDFWNAHNTPKVERLTTKRKAAIKHICKEYTEDEIAEVFRKIPTIPFLVGQNDRGWQANFDYATRPEAFLKIYEGGWDTKPQGMESTNFDEWNK
jgi:hypothetical protein